MTEQDYRTMDERLTDTINEIKDSIRALKCEQEALKKELESVVHIEQLNSVIRRHNESIS